MGLFTRLIDLFLPKPPSVAEYQRRERLRLLEERRRNDERRRLLDTSVPYKPKRWW